MTSGLTADLVTIDEVQLLDALDFVPAVACDRKGHDQNAAGCVAAEPARWRVIAMHTTGRPIDKCAEPVQHVICDPAYQHTAAELGRQFEAPCIACGGPHIAVMACPNCGAILSRLSDVLVLVGEV